MTRMTLCEPDHDLRVYSQGARSRPDHDVFTWLPLASCGPSPPPSPGALTSCPPTEVRCMSSLDHDHLLHEGPETRKRAGSTLAPAGGTRPRRPAASPAAEKVSTSAPAPRTRAAKAGRQAVVTATATKETVSKAARTGATATRTARAKATQAAATTVSAAK